MRKIAVYAGHGGSDVGAVGNALMEKNVTLQVALATSKVLRESGYRVVLNRTTDMDSTIAQKTEVAKREGVDALVEIHLNANDGQPGTGTEVYYSVRGGVSQTLAGAILEQIVALGYRNRGLKTKLNAVGQDYFGIIRQAGMPAVLVETAFINNPDDMKRYDPESMGRAIAKGIMAIFPAKSGAAQDSGTQEKGTTQNGPEYQLGDTVTLNGYVYLDSYAGGRGQYYTGKVGVITKREPLSRLCPYHFAGLGWVTAQSIHANSERHFQVGEQICVKTTATRYATGETMAPFVKGGTYFIRQLRPGQALIAPKNSGNNYTGWICLADIQ